MDPALDVVHRGKVEPDRGGVLNDFATWLGDTLGLAPRDLVPFERALTHSSQSGANYERLEFLGDRVLGIVMADWLYKLFPGEAEGQLSKRLNSLVTGSVCAGVAREIGVVPFLRLGKQARDDGAADSDNVLGDVVEALIGALYLDAGLDAARGFVRQHWASRVEQGGSVPQHPKSALQEWAAANNRKPPVYEIVERSGPGHAPRFTVKVSIGRQLEASAEGKSKQEAETAAAVALLGRVTSKPIV